MANLHLPDTAIGGAGETPEAPAMAPAVAKQAEGQSADGGLDPAMAALCAPISADDHCGPDLELAGDSDYLNVVARLDSVMPTAFFSVEDGRPFDPSSVDIGGELASLKPLLARSRDIRLLVTRARLTILNRDISSFAANVAVLAAWLDRFWDEAHPRPEHGDLGARLTALAELDRPLVTFPLQYAPLFEARRGGKITYRAIMIANGETKPRPGDAALDASTIAEALGDAAPADLAAARKHLVLLKSSLDTIRNAFLAQGSSVGLGGIAALVDKMTVFIDPQGIATAAAGETAQDGATAQPRPDGGSPTAAGPAPATAAEATAALAAIADYYSRLEPSSPALPLLRQAHQLIGKSFLEVMTALVPSQVDKAAFQIGTDQVFDLPLGKLQGASAASPAANGNGAAPAEAAAAPASPHYRVEARPQAFALLDQVQHYFRRCEPSSPVPMLCQRARALAERDFMGVLRELLPKSALKNAGAER